MGTARRLKPAAQTDLTRLRQSRGLRASPFSPRAKLSIVYCQLSVVSCQRFKEHDPLCLLPTDLTRLRQSRGL